MTRAGLALLLCVGIVGCGDDGPGAVPPVEWPSEAERTMSDETAPTPFTAQQIRDGCWAGRKVTWKIESKGRDPRYQTFHFLDGDAEACEFEIVATSLDGEVLSEPHKSRAPWTELQAHASYPLEDTTITEVTLETATGTYDCFLYTVTRDADGTTAVTQFWFSKAHAGPPIQIVTTVDGEETARHTLVSDEDVAPDDAADHGR